MGEDSRLLRTDQADGRTRLIKSHDVPCNRPSHSISIREGAARYQFERPVRSAGPIDRRISVACILVGPGESINTGRFGESATSASCETEKVARVSRLFLSLDPRLIQ